MIWFFKNNICYDFGSNEEISNDLTKRFHNSVYENSSEMELWYALEYMNERNWDKLSVIFPIDNLSVQYGDNKDFNKEYCDNHNILYRYERRNGGCMVLFPGNIIALDIRPKTSYNVQILQKFSDDFVNYLSNKGLNSTVDNNDILVDDKKIAGIVLFPLPAPYEHLIYFGIQVSINSDIDLINRICTKPMMKTPGALSNYGIGDGEVIDWMLKWFRAHPSIKE